MGIRMPDFGKKVTYLNVGLGALGLSLGILPLVGIAAPMWLTSVGWVAVGVAGIMFLFGMGK